jgi:hypothetical protein
VFSRLSFNVTLVKFSFSPEFEVNVCVNILTVSLSEGSLWITVFGVVVL